VLFVTEFQRCSFRFFFFFFFQTNKILFIEVVTIKQSLQSPDNTVRITDGRMEDC